MDKERSSSIGKGVLFISSPEITDGIYFRSVILICEHSPAGSFGLIINKPIDIELPSDILDLSHINNPNVQLRFGGPVQTNQLMLLHSNSTPSPHTLEICSQVFLGGDMEFLQEGLSSMQGAPLRLCFGYTGWGPGQLEREFMDGMWFIHPGKSEYVFDTPYDKVWQRVLREMGGKYATLSMIPEDLSLN